MSSDSNPSDFALTQALLERISNDLGMVIDRPVSLGDLRSERAREKAAAKGGIHVSFRLAFARGSQSLHGCLLVPLPDAISVACYMMMASDDSVNARRADKTLDKGTKDAMLEVGNFIGGATDAALRETEFKHFSARADGCQGVQGGDRPSFRFEPGGELILARARLQVHNYPTSELVLMLPPLPAAVERAA